MAKTKFKNPIATNGKTYVFDRGNVLTNKKQSKVKIKKKQDDQKRWHKFHINLKENHFLELKELADYEDRSVGSIIRQLVSRFLRDLQSENDELNNRITFDT